MLRNAYINGGGSENGVRRVVCGEIFDAFECVPLGNRGFWWVLAVGIDMHGAGGQWMGHGRSRVKFFGTGFGGALQVGRPAIRGLA